MHLQANNLLRPQLIATFFVCVLSAIWSSSSLAWSREGHIWIAQSAATELREAEEAKFDELLKAGSLVAAEYFHAQLGERLGALAAWPDTIRDETLAEVFKSYGSGTVPPSLKPYAKRDTNLWHFSNEIYVNERGGKYSGSCKTKNKGELLSVWPVLFKAYSEVDSTKDKNIVLAFILHLAGDAYQPLHLMSAIRSDCKSDRGGNGTCVVAKAGGKECELNLHRLWDGGLDTFKQVPDWYQQKHPTNIFSFNDALKLAEEAALTVYANEKTGYLSPEYITLAQALSMKQADYAVGHTRFVLKHLINQ